MRWLGSLFGGKETNKPKQVQTDEEFVQSVVNGAQSFADSLRNDGMQAEALFYCGYCGFLPISQYPHDCPQERQC